MDSNFKNIIDNTAEKKEKWWRQTAVRSARDPQGLAAVGSAAAGTVLFCGLLLFPDVWCPDCVQGLQGGVRDHGQSVGRTEVFREILFKLLLRKNVCQYIPAEFLWLAVRVPDSDSSGDHAQSAEQ